MIITSIMALVIGVFSVVVLTLGAIACPATADPAAWYRFPVWSAMLIWRRVVRAYRAARRIFRLQIWSIEIVYVRRMVRRIISRWIDTSARESEMDSIRSLVTSLVALRLSETVRPMVREEIEHKISLVVTEEIASMIGIGDVAPVNVAPVNAKDQVVKLPVAIAPVKVAPVKTIQPTVVQPSILVTTENRPAGQIVFCVQRPGMTGQIAQNNPRVSPVLCSETGKLALLRSKDGASTSVVVILGVSGNSFVYRPISNGVASRLALPVARERITVQPDPYGTKIVSGASVTPTAQATPVVVTTPQVTPPVVVAVKRGRGRPMGAKNGTHNGQPVAGAPVGATSTTITAQGTIVLAVPSNPVAAPVTSPATYTIPAVLKVNGREIKPLLAGDSRLVKPRDLWLVRLDTGRVMLRNDGTPLCAYSDGPRGIAALTGRSRTPVVAVLPSDVGTLNN